MKTFVLSVCLLVTLLPCSGGSINFDDQATTTSTDVQLTNQYLSMGVVFQDMTASQRFKFNIVPPSTLNYATPFFVDLNPGLIIFVQPGNAAVNATVSTVSFTLVGLTVPDGHPGNYSGATIDALDLAGNVIPGQTVTIPGTATATSDQILTFTGAIHELRFTHTNGTSGAFPIDNLTFAPEPSSIGLLGAALGIVSLGYFRKRR